MKRRKSVFGATPRFFTRAAVTVVLLLVALSAPCCTAQSTTVASSPTTTAAAAAATTTAAAVTTSTTAATTPAATVRNSTTTGAATTRAPTTSAATSTTAPRHHTRTRTLVVTKPSVIASTYSIQASALADRSSQPSARRVLLTIRNGVWNTTWCATSPQIAFAQNQSGLVVAQPCGLISLINNLIGVDSLSCTMQTLQLTFNPVANFAELYETNENIAYSFIGSYVIPAVTLPAIPLTIVADQGPNITCNNKTFTNAPPVTNLTTAAPIYYLPWPSDVDLTLWNIAFGFAAVLNLAASSSTGALHMVWFHRMTLLCSHNCNWENVTDVPAQNDPFQITLDLPSYFPDRDALKFAPFMSGLIFNLVACIGVTLLHLLAALAFAAKLKSLAAGMAKVRFPGALTFPTWTLFYIPTVSAGVTVFANSSQAPNLSPMVLVITAIVLFVFFGAMAANVVLTVLGMHARTVKVDPKIANTHWATTPTVAWGDRLGFAGYTVRFSTIFRQFIMTRSWYLWAELLLLTFQGALAGYRTTWPDCKTSTFTPLAVTGVLSLFAALVLDPFAVFVDRIAMYSFSGALLAGGIAAAFAGGDSDTLESWATRVDQIGIGGMALTSVYAVVMIVIFGARWHQGNAFTAEMASEEEEKRLAGRRLRAGLEGEPKELIADMTPEELEELQRQQEEEARNATAPSLNPSVLAEPDPELREVLMTGKWVRMETEKGPYYYNQATLKRVWDLRDELGLPPLYRKRFTVNDLSDDEPSDSERNTALGRRLLGDAPKKAFDVVGDALAKREWIAVTDAQGRTYYYHSTSGETTWDLAERLGVAKTAEEAEAEEKAKSDKVAQALAKGDWVKVESPDGGAPYYYHAASRKTVWNLRQELGLDDTEEDIKKLPPPPPPAIADRAVVPKQDVEMIAALMMPTSPQEYVPLPIKAEARLWWLPQPPGAGAPQSSLNDPLLSAVDGMVNPLASAAASPMRGGAASPTILGMSAIDAATAAQDASLLPPHGQPTALMKILQEQSMSPTRRDDPVSMLMAHALATRQWVETYDEQRGTSFFVNPVTKEITDDLRAVFEAQHNYVDPVEQALANKEWIKMLDPVSNRDFYVHVLTRRVSWDLRAELEASAREKVANNKKKKRGPSTAAKDMVREPSGILRLPSQQQDNDDSGDSAARRKKKKRGGSRRVHVDDSSVGRSGRRRGASPSQHSAGYNSTDRSQGGSTAGDDSDSSAYDARAARSRRQGRPAPAPQPDESKKSSKAPAYGSAEYYRDLWDCL